MSRTFIVNNAPIHSSTPHEMQTAVERALREGNVVDNPALQPFHFDLLETVKSIRIDKLRNDTLNRLQFSIDGYISGALSSLLNQFYQFSKTEASTLSWATYTDFLRHIEGIEATEQSLYEAGCDVSPAVARIKNLIEFRAQLHYLSASQLRDPTTYVVPQLADTLANPRVRTLSAASELGLMEIVKDDAGDDEELAKELLAQYKFDDQVDRLNQHRMDMMKAKALVVLLSCMPIDPDAPVSEDDDAFFAMDVRTQFGLLNSAMRAITETRRKAVTDNRLPVLEKAALRVEAKALLTTFTTALEHAIFADLAG